jgi:hypothetical protein
MSLLGIAMALGMTALTWSALRERKNRPAP